MTIGPAPMMRTLWMSVRLGMMRKRKSGERARGRQPRTEREEQGTGCAATECGEPGAAPCRRGARAAAEHEGDQVDEAAQLQEGPHRDEGQPVAGHRVDELRKERDVEHQR